MIISNGEIVRTIKFERQRKIRIKGKEERRRSSPLPRPSLLPPPLPRARRLLRTCPPRDAKSPPAFPVFPHFPNAESPLGFFPFSSAFGAPFGRRTAAAEVVKSGRGRSNRSSGSRPSCPLCLGFLPRKREACKCMTIRRQQPVDFFASLLLKIMLRFISALFASFRTLPECSRSLSVYFKSPILPAPFPVCYLCFLETTNIHLSLDKTRTPLCSEGVLDPQRFRGSQRPSLAFPRRLKG